MEVELNDRQLYLSMDLLTTKSNEVNERFKNVGACVAEYGSVDGIDISDLSLLAFQALDANKSIIQLCDFLPDDERTKEVREIAIESIAKYEEHIKIVIPEELASFLV